MSKKKEISGLITGLVTLIAVACFIILGFTTGAWYLVWMVFLAIPITAIIADFAAKKKDFSGSLVGVVSLLAVIAFMLMGFLYSLWNIAWIVFLLIPISAIIMNIIKAAKKDEQKDEEKSEEKD